MNNRSSKLAFLITVMVFLLTGRSFPEVKAQSLDDPWYEPVNLSRSGAAENPIMVIDRNETVHVFWTDEFDGPMYVQRDGEEWGDPVQVNVPFEDFTPLILADSQGYLHAFWTDEEQVLRYSKVLGSSIQNSAWGSMVTLASSAVVFDVGIDIEDRFHLAYINGADSPESLAGVYYRQSGSGGNGWGAGQQLYQSPYFRILTPETSHIDLEIANLSDLFVTWDDRARSRVYLTISEDGGAVWGEPVEIDQPVEESDSTIPTDLSVHAQNGNVLLLWKVRSDVTGCSQYYQWSEDGGETWEPRQSLSDQFFGCADQQIILRGQTGPLLLINSFQYFLQSWNGARWSTPQVQSPLTSFVDPDTLQVVDLGCLHSAILDGDLFVVGCGTGDIQDIWWLRRGLDDVNEWFPEESVWQSLGSITRGDSRFLSMTRAADTEENLHLIWSEQSNGSVTLPGTSLHYSRWEDQSLWTAPVVILDTPEDIVDQPDVEIDLSGRLLLTMQRGREGEIYFSQADSSQAALPSSWTEPQRISSPGQICSSPEVLVSNDGEIFVVYSIPVNTGRGIYLTRSRDGGETWTDPSLIFDGASAGWSMLDHPHLTQATNGNLHILWTRYSLISGQPNPVGLGYAHSMDDGATWSEVDLVTENPVSWSQIYAGLDNTVHRIWRESSGTGDTLWHQLSEDNGLTWTRIPEVPSFGEPIGDPFLTWDRDEGMHILQVAEQGAGSRVLQHWTWDGQQWLVRDDLDMELETSVDNLVSAVSLDGTLSVILSTWQSDPDVEARAELLFTTRSIDLAEDEPTPQTANPVTTDEISTVTPEPTLLPTSTPTPNVVPLDSSGSDGSAESSYIGIVIGAILAGITVVFTVGFSILKAKGG